MIRLHKHAAILVTRDAEALAELLATESARPCIGPQLSPTAAWIDHRRVEVLREALIRAGYTPKVTREGGPEDGNDAD
jgi:hypothetical protein